jgi:hypothetical protein
VTRHTATGAIETVVVLPDIHASFPFVQPMPEGGFALVGGRAAWHPQGPEHNAYLYSTSGDLLATGCLGDGISHLQTDDHGFLWAGYFDEGVFGNFGWGSPGPTPLGAPGIVAWSKSFDVVWALDPAESVVSDCYAFNVSREAVVACTFAGFPILRIAGGSCTLTPTQGIRGPWGILADEARVAILGSYDRPGSATLAHVSDGVYVEDVTFDLAGLDWAVPGPRWVPAVARSPTRSWGRVGSPSTWLTWSHSWGGDPMSSVPSRALVPRLRAGGPDAGVRRGRFRAGRLPWTVRLGEHKAAPEVTLRPEPDPRVHGPHRRCPIARIRWGVRASLTRERRRT